MYAYKQQAQFTTLHAVPSKETASYSRPKHINPIRKRKAVKKKNPLVEFARAIVRLTLLFAFIICAFPTAFNGLVKQIILPSSLSTAADNSFDMRNNDPAYSTSVNLYELANPSTKYLHNDMFQNRLLLTPTRIKTHNEVTTMYHTSEMTGLKKDLFDLMAQYPTIKPAIYVWEYDNGTYLNINADKIYPAASIIKLPILVRMFKSIEANQFTIYDEMVMKEQYRSSGSGDLQYKTAGQKYTMDYLAKTMIQDSDNTSTNMIMAKLGGMDDVNIGLRDWGIPTTYVRTWLPDLKGTNKTTADDIAKILYNLDNPGFLNINSREYIIDYLSHVKNDRLIQAGLGEGALFIHKTGDIGSMLGDAGIVFAPNGKKYIVVILAERPYNSPLGRDFIVKASEIIYNTVAL